MLFVISAEDKPDSLAKRLTHRQAHRVRLQELLDQGRLIVAGPNPAVESTEPGEAGYTGSLIVAEFDSQNAAEAWANADPYVLNNTYDKVTVKPFIKVFP